MDQNHVYWRVIGHPSVRRFVLVEVDKRMTEDVHELGHLVLRILHVVSLPEVSNEVIDLSVIMAYLNRNPHVVTSEGVHDVLGIVDDQPVIRLECLFRRLVQDAMV